MVLRELSRVFNDIFLAMDSGESLVLVPLDLTAAFDTVDHIILLSRLEHRVGIKGSALELCRSYLTERTFCFRLGDAMSSASLLWSTSCTSGINSWTNFIYVILASFRFYF